MRLLVSLPTSKFHHHHCRRRVILPCVEDYSSTTVYGCYRYTLGIQFITWQQKLSSGSAVSRASAPYLMFGPKPHPISCLSSVSQSVAVLAKCKRPSSCWLKVDDMTNRSYAEQTKLTTAPWAMACNVTTCTTSRTHKFLPHAKKHYAAKWLSTALKALSLSRLV